MKSVTGSAACFGFKFSIFFCEGVPGARAIPRPGRLAEISLLGEGETSRVSRAIQDAGGIGITFLFQIAQNNSLAIVRRKG